MKRLLISVSLALALAGCASVQPGTPLDPLQGGTARQAWRDLSVASSYRGTLSTYASVRVTTLAGKRSFRSTILVDDEGRVQMSAFTPVGTGVFSFEVIGDEMSFADHSSKASWRGEFREVARQLGIPDDLTASEFAMLVFGFPVGAGELDLSAVGSGVVRRGPLVYEIDGLGLSTVSREGTTWQVRYEPSIFPPEKVTFDDGEGRAITVRHLDLSYEKGRLGSTDLAAKYRCCFKPVIAAR